MRRAFVSLGIIAASLSIAGPASATPPPIAVAVPDCPTAPLSIDAFLGSLRVELAAEAQPCCTRAPAAAPPATEPRNPVSVALGWTCEPGSNQVTIQVRDDQTGVALDRQAALGDVAADARPRALALAVAELIRTAVATPTPPPAAPAPAPPPPAPAAARSKVVEVAQAAERADLDGWLPNAGFAVATYPSGNLTLWGFRGGVEYAHAGWAVAAAVFIESGNPTVTLGSVDTTFAGGQLRLGGRFRLARAPFEVAAAGSLGVVRMDGVSSVPGATVTSGSSLVSAAGVWIAYDFWQIPHDRARLRLLAEGGAVLRGMQATVNNQNAVALTGGYAMLGLAFTLGPYGR
jgi:hypothetical protein